MDESSTNQSQLWRDSIDENTIAENEATDEIIDDMKDPSPVRKGRRSSPTKKEIIQKHMTPGGVVSSYKTVAACEDELERGRLQEKIEKAQLDVMAKRKVALEAREKADREIAKRRELEQHIVKLNNDIERLGPHKENVILVQKVSKELAQTEYQLREQKQFEEREIKLMYHSEKEADYADMLLEKYSDAVGVLERHKVEERDESKIVARYRNKKEQQSAMRFEKRRKKKQARFAKQMAAQDKLADNQVQVTKIQHAIAKDNYRTLLKEQKETYKEVMDVHAKEHDERTRALLKLKKSTEVANAQMQGKTAKKKAREKKIEQKQKQEFDAILADGRNPYEEFRRRKQQAKFKADKQKLIEKEIYNKNEIARKMIKEEIHFVKEDKVIREHAKFADVYRASLGRHVTEERTTKYIQKLTKTGSDFVDPTGRMFRIEGSQHTAIPDNSLGIGRLAKERPDVIAKKASERAMRGVSHNELHSYVKGAALEPDSDDEGDSKPTDKYEELLGKVEKPGATLQINKNNSGAAPVMTDFESDILKSEKASTRASSVATTVTDSGRKVYKQRELTKLEKQYQEKAKIRHRENIVGKQIVWGKEFKGDAFISKPAKIIFKDFDVGKKMKIRFSLTNVSYTFNHFKLLDLDDEIKDFFEITYDKPGRMSAGTSCSILIEFDPKLNKDIVSILPVLSHTGPINIPLECYTKKVVPSISTALIDMGTVVLGDDVQSTCKFLNDGALPTNYHIEEITSLDEFNFDAETNELLVDPVKDMEVKPAMLNYAANDSMKGYSKNKVPFTFRPRQPGKLHRVLKVTFDGSDVEIILTITALSLKVPIYVDKRLTDMKCCVYDKLYRAPVRVRNRGNVALKMQTKVPKELQHALGMFPPMGFVQAADKASGEAGLFVVQMKFRTTSETLKLCEKYRTDPSDPNIIVVPVTIDVPDQTLAVIFRIKSKLTSSDIIFEPKEINFGPCFTEQSVHVPLTITNTCALPQKFGFVNLPREISVPEDDGFGTLLPNETIVRNIVFSPVAAVPVKLKLKMCTYLDREFNITCNGVGVEPVISLNYNLIKMQACPVGEKVVKSIMVRNITKKMQMFEFNAPSTKIAGITVCPSVGKLKPNEACRVEVTYKPDLIKIAADGSDTSKPPPPQKSIEDLEDENASTTSSRPGSKNSKKGKGKGKKSRPNSRASKKSDKSEEKAESEEKKEDPLAYLNETALVVEEPPFVMPPPFEGSVDWSEKVNGGEEDWSRHGVWKIPCYTKQLNDDGSSTNDSIMDQPLVCLEVHTVSTEKMFNAEVPHDVISRFPASTSSKLDFGQMAVGQVEVAPIVVANLNAKATILRMIQPPNTHGPFSVVNALRPLAEFGDLHGKATRNLFIQFRPERQLKYAEKIIIETDFGAATIRLIGQGVEPVLQVTPEDGKVDLGQVLAGDSARKTIMLKNCSVFPLTYNIVGRGSMPTNYNGTSVFSCVPEGAVIQPNAEQEVTVSIRPDHELAEPYSCVMMVRVPTTDEKKAVEKRLTLKGRCWQRQLYVRALQAADDVKPGSKEAVDDTFSIPPELGVDTAEGREDLKTPARTHKITLKFPKKSENAEVPTNDGGKGQGGLVLEKEIAIGATAINEPGRDGKGGTFEIGAPLGGGAGAEYFSFEPNKGSLSAGGEVIVKVKFTPPAEEEKSEDDPCVTIGRWNELTYPCILKGGYVPEGVEPEEQVEIVVSGFVVGN